MRARPRSPPRPAPQRMVTSGWVPGDRTPRYCVTHLYRHARRAWIAPPDNLLRSRSSRTGKAAHAPDLAVLSACTAWLCTDPVCQHFAAIRRRMNAYRGHLSQEWCNRASPASPGPHARSYTARQGPSSLRRLPGNSKSKLPQQLYLPSSCTSIEKSLHFSIKFCRGCVAFKLTRKLGTVTPQRTSAKGPAKHCYATHP